MERDRSSTTAEFTAAMRADHLLHDADPVLEDTWALRLVAPGLRESVEKGEYHALLERSGLRPTQGHIVLRARFADDALGAVESGFLAAATSATFAVVFGGAACLFVVAFMAWALPELRSYRIGANVPVHS